MSNNSAVDDLVRLASDPAGAPESIREAIGAVFKSLSPNDRPGAESVLRRLAEDVIDAPTRADAAGTIAVCCGALVERGLDPRIALGAILDRLEREVLPEAITFVAACRQAAEDSPPPPSEGSEKPQQTDPIEQHGEAMAELMPTEARSFHAIEPFSLAAVAMLGRSVEARKASWSRTALRASLDELGGQYGYAGLLWMMMQVLDDELIAVVHPEQRKGYRVRITGLADNFQLHTLLADALIGRFSSRWLRGNRPAATDVAAAGSGPVSENSPPAVGVFNLWDWRGLKQDGTLFDAMSGSAFWIWNEGVPADIPPFEGTRVVLLGPPPYPRSWTAGRKYPFMAGSVRVESVMTPGEVSDLLGRIAAATPSE